VYHLINYAASRLIARDVKTTRVDCRDQEKIADIMELDTFAEEDLKYAYYVEDFMFNKTGIDCAYQHLISESQVSKILFKGGVNSQRLKKIQPLLIPKNLRHLRPGNVSAKIFTLRAAPTELLGIKRYFNTQLDNTFHDLFSCEREK
jgi:hypothetical protein